MVSPNGRGFDQYRGKDELQFDSRSRFDRLDPPLVRAPSRSHSERCVQSRLNFTNEQPAVTKENLSAAISRIADVEVAEEATAYARYQILVQSGTSMLAQANKMPQSVLQLLQN